MIKIDFTLKKFALDISMFNFLFFNLFQLKSILFLLFPPGLSLSHAYILRYIALR